ncbi:Alpha,alpha-trehalose-phosphate synthase [UDP-forming] [Blastochloris viridis]|uniref:Alpha,alpha-trehalose-phosphate synthase n=2 Tax=Blastochloris viridis TaxID=1079 RepID=A0A0H5BPJ7_BLAVI|nr:Alpha,alpha-trehalose-phosphate synthase [UDP-forming] [Blastochloris viridis]BAR99408.1 alpha,alpha-trehalose-phosphate synthase [Blastochloris viridis]CUU43298.1 Alpha,alpha-trehalose-phosphate synthase [UDP-forming] [Blastochloris viridis]
MRLVVVSNRVAAPDGEGKTAAGGLAVALRAALQQQGGIWFGWSGKVTDEPAAQPTIVRRGKVGYAVVDLTAVDRDEYYLGFANRALWPNMHYRLGLTQFSRAEYSGYMRVNRRFAEALAAILQPSDLVWVHDYHLIPFAAELRRLGVTNRIGYFHHIPWPPIDVFGALPGCQDLLLALTAYDLVGVQTARDAGNLVRAIEEAGPEARQRLDRGALKVAAFPIGIDTMAFHAAALRAEDNSVVQRTMDGLAARDLVIGVDRLDYSKGIVERLESFERFLIANPDRRGNVVLLQISPHSRSEVPEYEQLDRQTDSALGRINSSLGDPSWTPIRFIKQAYTRPVLAGLYRHAAVGLVTPMRDGMNLVAKEYVAAQRPEDPGVLVLSRFAGAAEQMTEALIVNPYDKFEVAMAIGAALLMPKDERISRWQALFEGLRRQDITWWTRTFIDALARK